jgi:hypothetical protein
MTTTRCIGFGLALILGLAAGAEAFSFKEFGDAGDLPAFAQAAGVLPPGDFGRITGSISHSRDVDMFAFTTTIVGNIFASTLGTPGTLADTQLFLFGFPGLGLAANDDFGGKGELAFRSSVTTSKPGAFAIPPGLYFIGISSFDVDPVSPGGLIFPNFPFTGPSPFVSSFGPTGPGGSSAITGWAGTGTTGTYAIDLAVSPVPEPATLLLVGTTMAGLGLARLRRWRQKQL